jgi:hypothetical protein
MDLCTRYRQDGFLVCPGLLDLGTVQRLRDETVAIACGQRGHVDGMVPLPGRGEEALKDLLAIHFPHKVSALMREMITWPSIVDILTQIVAADLKCMQSMLFVKNAGKPGQAWHQDETFIPTQDASLTGVWISLDDATVNNGCLWVQPGSHRQRHLWPSRACTDPRFDGSCESHGWEGPDWPAEGGVAVEVAAGSVVFFNGYTLHRSLDNRRATGFRRALVNHVMSAHSELPWSFGGSKFAPSDYRDIVIVAGGDPYADRGLEDLARPYLRPETVPR